MRDVRILLAAILFPLLALSNACSIYAYERGTVKRVETKKTITPAVVEARAAPAAVPGAIRIHLVKRARVSLERTRVHNTIEWESHGDAARPAWEVLEFLTSPLYMILLPPLVIAGVGMESNADFQWSSLAKLQVATAVWNPCITIFGTTLERDATVAETRFRDPPLTLEYGTAFPLSEVKIGYRLLDAKGNEVAKGAAKTDVFGDAYVVGAEGAKAVEVTAEGGVSARAGL